ncbi:IS4 family transposase [Acrocarpospora macrocephala]|uniref:IS4 family transposase n=2 Tax=Acrocarpospora macrocephala TaxID=150177 RepID=UPI001478D09E|nr:IS4 family transposase [Acrocarpospora macrocephala]
MGATPAIPLLSLSGEHPLDRLGLGAVPDLLPAQLIDEVIAECGRQQQRVRALPARIALYFTLALWFCPGQGYAEVLRVLFRQLRHHLRVGLWRIPTVSAAVKARGRLGREPLKALFRRLRGPHADPSEPGMSMFGLELALLKVSVDGTSLNVADTAANRAAFGAPPRNGKGATGPFPKIRLLTLIACGTRTIVDAVWGPFATGELTLLGKLVGLGALRPGMLVLADRYFSGYPQVAQVIAAGADLIFRAQNNRRLPVLAELPDGSYLSVLPAANLPSKGDRHRAGGGHCPRLGLKKRQARGLRIRVVEAVITVVPEQGEPRVESYLLITTLLDPAVAPAEKIAELYHERWESETGYADLKTYLRGRQHILRSKSPNGVAQELYALLIVYQLVQITRCRAARAHPDQTNLDPDRVSFTVTLRALARSIGEIAAPGRLLRDVFEEVWGQPLLQRRARAKPHELKGTPAFTRALQRTPPGRVAYKITTRKPPVSSA